MTVQELRSARSESWRQIQDRSYVWLTWIYSNFWAAFKQLSIFIETKRAHIPQELDIPLTVHESIDIDPAAR